MILILVLLVYEKENRRRMNIIMKENDEINIWMVMRWVNYVCNLGNGGGMYINIGKINDINELDHDGSIVLLDVQMNNKIIIIMIYENNNIITNHLKEYKNIIN